MKFNLSEEQMLKAVTSSVLELDGEELEMIYSDSEENGETRCVVKVFHSENTGKCFAVELEYTLDENYSFMHGDTPWVFKEPENGLEAYEVEEQEVVTTVWVSVED